MADSRVSIRRFPYLLNNIYRRSFSLPFKTFSPSIFFHDTVTVYHHRRVVAVADLWKYEISLVWDKSCTFHKSFFIFISLYLYYYIYNCLTPRCFSHTYYIDTKLLPSPNDEGYVFISVVDLLGSVCLSVSNFSDKQMNKCSWTWNFLGISSYKEKSGKVWGGVVG